jgi:NAD(P)H-dependent flavin oxidoreductase YrpB (nitropropane dioxygenase family)
VDIVCGQGGEGGGHTGDVSTMILIPALVDAVKGRVSPLTGKPIQVVAAGGISDGRGLAASLAMGATGVWVGTRFVCATEAGAPPAHQKAIIGADFQDTTRTLIISGRPLRVIKNPYVVDWEENRSQEMKELTAKGILPMQHDIEAKQDKGEATPEFLMSVRPWLSGQVAGRIKSVNPAKEIVDEMVAEALQQIRGMSGMVSKSKL